MWQEVKEELRDLGKVMLIAVALAAIVVAIVFSSKARAADEMTVAVPWPAVITYDMVIFGGEITPRLVAAETTRISIIRIRSVYWDAGERREISLNVDLEIQPKDPAMAEDLAKGFAKRLEGFHDAILARERERAAK